MRTRICPQCSIGFNTYQAKFCSKSCYTAWQKGKDLIGEEHRYRLGIPPIRVGKDHPNYKPKYEFNCKYCGVAVIQRNYRRLEAKYCSRVCHYQDNDGLSTENEKARKNQAYKDWRVTVFKRDNFTCVQCGTRGGYLHADHIKSFARFPELRLEVSNGQTLCVPCHKATPTYGGRSHRAVGQEA